MCWSIKKLECRRSGHKQKHTEADCVKKMRAIVAGQCTDGQKQTKGSTIYTWGESGNWTQENKVQVKISKEMEAREKRKFQVITK